MIGIIDYDIGNIGAVANMLKRLGFPCGIATTAEDVEQADHIILPGNGAFDACMRNLHASGLIPVLEQQVLKRGVPLLGICVGAQMLGVGSAEGAERGLGWVNMQVKRFPHMPGLRVPHMGWNRVYPAMPKHPLVQEMAPDARFYFVHSYYMMTNDPHDVLLSSDYGVEFAAGIVKDNVVGVQFHPEKSHRFGKQFLAAFVRG
ncbi:imidazole glycerol phosphate synthase subunit HisH [Castellaniella sp.]|uniref:imidazole glycerol phosphate synthase subunit HisH n=1 Tax=Castellaniella sp. TaxID=1955812 RepID=UPI003C7322DE